MRAGVASSLAPGTMFYWFLLFQIFRQQSKKNTAFTFRHCKPDPLDHLKRNRLPFSKHLAFYFLIRSLFTISDSSNQFCSLHSVLLSCNGVLSFNIKKIVIDTPTFFPYSHETEREISFFVLFND